MEKLPGLDAPGIAQTNIDLLVAEDADEALSEGSKPSSPLNTERTEVCCWICEGRSEPEEKTTAVAAELLLLLSC